METTLTSRRKQKKSTTLKPHATPEIPTEDKIKKSGLCLKRYRVERHVRQTVLRKRLGFKKNRLIRLESKPLEEVTLGELLLFSEGIGAEMDDLYFDFKGSYKERVCRSSLKKPLFFDDREEGASLGGFTKNTGPYFIASLSLRPRQSLSINKSRNAEFLFFFILEGALHLKLPRMELVLKEKDCCAVYEKAICELLNPDYSKPLLTLVVTSPSLRFD